MPLLNQGLGRLFFLMTLLFNRGFVILAGNSLYDRSKSCLQSENSVFQSSFFALKESF